MNEELLRAVAERSPVAWLRGERPLDRPLDARLIEEAAERLDRCAPWIAARFPETAAAGGLIESPIQEAPALQRLLNEQLGGKLRGRLFLKRDDSLPISGSIKARGGIHEVLQLACSIAEELSPGAPLKEAFDSPEFRARAARINVAVGSTGNLGLSIGTIGPALGFPTRVHMSVDAKQWKKELLRRRGSTVIEHEGLFSEAIAAARAETSREANAYFVDDEYSFGLLAGYAVAALRLRTQLEAANIAVDASHPLHVYLPCGVGGGPGGVTFGLKHVFGDHVRCHFVEPVDSPCMLIGVATGLGHGASCYDLGLSGHTLADGLAVQRPSQLIVDHVSPMVDSFHTVTDEALLAAVSWLHETEEVFVEPSATAGLTAAWRVDSPPTATHLVWLTGGSLVPASEREQLLRGTRKAADALKAAAGAPATAFDVFPFEGA